MDTYSPYSGARPAAPLSTPEKAAAILLAMGKPVAGRLLKFFQQSELQKVIACAQTLRQVPPDELAELVGEFEALFSEGTGLMDNARAIEGILEEGLTPDEVDGLLGRRQAVEQRNDLPVWERLEAMEPAALARILARENAQIIAYIVSMLPAGVAGRTLLALPEAQRPDILRRALNMKQVNPRVAAIVERRVKDIVGEMESQKNNAGPAKVADMMNEMEKPEVETLLGSLETISRKDAERVRPRIFLFDDIAAMPARSRATLFNDISGDVITTALRGAQEGVREAVLSAIGARQRRMIESDLAAGSFAVRENEIAAARRSICQEAIRLASEGTIELRETAAAEAEAA